MEKEKAEKFAKIANEVLAMLDKRKLSYADQVTILSTAIDVVMFEKAIIKKKP